MSLSELLPAIQALTEADKRQLIQVLADDLAEISLNESEITPPAHLSGHEQELWRSAHGLEVLKELGTLGACSEMEDPAAWEREMRQDRRLPGRDAA